MQNSLRESDLEYIAAFLKKIPEMPMKELEPYITEFCPECDMNAQTSAYPHTVFQAQGNDEHWVLIGCEGYWVINPNLLGIDMPNWDSWVAADQRADGNY